MRARVLGAAAGGGFPQWNCACPNCELARKGDPRVTARTQDSLAVTSDGESWHVVNASPDIRAQIESNACLRPDGESARSADRSTPGAPRRTPIRSIVLTNGDLDHVLGLFSLRESTPLVVWATDAVRAGLEERNALMRTLHRFPEQLTWKRLELGRVHPLDDAITIEARAIAGKGPTHLAGLVANTPEENVALWLRHGDRTLVYASACGSLDGIEASFDDADALLFDGTFFSSDELVAQGLSRARAEEMAHLPVGGEHGSVARLARSRAKRKILTHVNNSNPILVAGSPQHRAVVDAGWEVAFDGMELSP